MREEPRRTLGRLGEELARVHLQRRGYEIVDVNFRTRFGELDIVAQNGRALVFCEVKTRRAGSGQPFESLHPRKQLQVRKMAREWLHAKAPRLRGRQYRFDAIGVTVDAAGRLVTLDHLEGAF
jgi:putative endonuclease